jgi:hypothetical protein
LLAAADLRGQPRWRARSAALVTHLTGSAAGSNPFRSFRSAALATHLTRS